MSAPVVSPVCLYCGAAIPPPRYRNRTKLFCKAAHRAAFYARLRQEAIENAIEALDAVQAGLEESRDRVEQALAVVAGQRDVLVGLRQKPRKERPEPAVIIDTISTVDTESS